MSNITPFVKRMRTQGGTLYTFSSAVEDIGLNINERNNIVKMSHFALLDIPEITAPININRNTFNILGIDGAFKNYANSNSIKSGTVLVAESFQNYALNLEANLLSQPTYNPSLQKTISERVFWKWLKETGAIRWTKDNNNGYWIEEQNTDSSVGYNSVVKYVGQISAGSIRTDTFGTYNETYILIPTSHGQTPIYFKQEYDENYKQGSIIGPFGSNIKGRENYTLPHPDGLSFLGQYDVIDSSTSINSWNLYYDTNDGSGYKQGWWYNAQNKYFNDENYYVIDASSAIDSSTYNYKLKYDNGSSSVEFYRSNVDSLGIEYNLSNLQNIIGDSQLTYDKLATTYSISSSFNFNAVLLYYSVYNNALDKILATNLLGVLFLDTASGNTSNFPDTKIVIPSISKLKTTSSGFGTSYSFRVNIKSNNLIDDTQAVIYDESTSSQTALENWTDVFSNLEKTLSILNSNINSTKKISEQYNNMLSTQNQQNDVISNIQSQIDGLELSASNKIYELKDSDNNLQWKITLGDLNELEIKDGNGELFVKLDKNGNLKIKGTIEQNGI